jgi:NAD-dependent SIR2 family protein deacetylase
MLQMRQSMPNNLPCLCKYQVYPIHLSQMWVDCYTCQDSYEGETMRIKQIPSWIQTRCKHCGTAMSLHYSKTYRGVNNYTSIAVRLYCLNCHFAVEIAPDIQIIGEHFTETTRGEIEVYNPSLFQEEEE